MSRLCLWMVAALFILPAFPQKPAGETTKPAAPEYVLGPNDQVSVWILGMEEIGDKPYPIDQQGSLNLPLVGPVKAAGLTTEQLKQELASRVAKEVRNPQVTVNVVEFRSQPVSVVGAVKSPGLVQLQGRKTLMEVLSLAGGLAPDAGHSVVITRRVEWGPIPVPAARQRLAGDFSVADINLKNLMASANPDDNIAVLPNDVITVPRAELYYVLGDVKKAGGFVMGEKKTISVIQALATAEGLGATAAAKNARILRSVPGEDRVDVQVDLKKILAGKANDIQLDANDILFVPTSTAKKITTRSIEAGLTLGTGILIWH